MKRRLLESILSNKRQNNASSIKVVDASNHITDLLSTSNVSENNLQLFSKQQMHCDVLSKPR